MVGIAYANSESSFEAKLTPLASEAAVQPEAEGLETAESAWGGRGYGGGGYGGGGYGGRGGGGYGGRGGGGYGGGRGGGGRGGWYG